MSTSQKHFNTVNVGISLHYLWGVCAGIKDPGILFGMSHDLSCVVTDHLDTTVRERDDI